MMRYFCTYFDRCFLAKALALFDSLRKWCPEHQVWALCMDDESYQALCELKLPDVLPIALTDLEAANPSLKEVRPNRTRVEYYFTCSPCLPLYVLERNPHVKQITYLDADLYFFSDPQPLFDEIGEASIAIIPHRFSQNVADRARFGIYNVGWISFRSDYQGLACLHWWRERCLEWCYARVDGDRYADQKYLERWPDLFQNVCILEHKGANVGPWNLASYRFSDRDGTVWVDNQPLIFFHFSSFMRLAPWLYNTNLASWHVRPLTTVRRRIVGPYVAKLECYQRFVGTGAVDDGQEHRVQDATPRFARFARRLRSLARIVTGLVIQNHLVIVRGIVL